ncbi:PRC-barrel domain containing protein [Desulfobacter hydrogenophilus]|uniref:PRC-barrel domain containing protein n=1 Tax=Desulfobacter hydrogenophilus TaxID=2291 RepID=A0A328FL90_9BACT|nr:PRC-barrel domain-containing protein [Desulfobacter hydrogenophilus]NDY72792.1 PRC-barrel domain containing protein [Desulfobacter hydrogenophilus]QBH13019.1 PRC-barrel domain containing protein [Desulfobacter hydrogenophilus]RAM04003.1 PRC-barrel domain containing protein [Desulfobacter hydrogenophilus]
MLRSANELIGYKLSALDQIVGSCKDFLFDDRWWTIRHMLADTGGWLIGQKVLISPMSITKQDWKTRHIYLNITKEQIEKCPSPSEDETVSRAHERKISQYYRIPYYWVDSGLWGGTAYPEEMDREISKMIPHSQQEESDEEGENHLRSLKEVTGYYIKANDGNIGHVEEFIMDEKTWALRYVVVDTRNWLPGGKKVLLPLKWAKSVSWANTEFEINLNKADIENGPEFDSKKPITIEYEAQIYDYYGRPFEVSIDKTTQQHIANPFV